MTSQAPNPNMDDPTTDLERDPAVTCIVLAVSQSEADIVLKSYAVNGQQFIGNIAVVITPADLPVPLPDGVKWCQIGACDPLAQAALYAKYGYAVRISEALGVVNVGKAIRTPNNPQDRLPVR